MSGVRRRLERGHQRRGIHRSAMTASIMQTGRIQVGRGLQFERNIKTPIVGVEARICATYGDGKLPGQRHRAAMPSRKVLARVRRMIPR